MATFSSRLGLRKPDYTDKITVSSDLNSNYDVVSDGVGVSVHDHAAKPGTPFAGQTVLEGDTKQLVVSDGDWKPRSMPLWARVPTFYVDELVNTCPADYDATSGGFPAGGIWEAFTSDLVVPTGGPDTRAITESRFTATTAFTFNAGTPTAVRYQSTTYESYIAQRVAGAVSDYRFGLYMPGVYRVSAGIRWNAATSGRRSLEIWKLDQAGNFVTTLGMETRDASVAAQHCVRAAFRIDDPNEFPQIEIVATQGTTGGASVTNVVGSFSGCNFCSIVYLHR